MEAEVQEHNAKKQIDQKAEEVQYPEASASKFEGAESQKQPEDEKDMMQDMEQPKVEFVGTDTTNAQQTVPENSTCERDTAKDENKPQVDRALQERENVKPEEKTNDDHGGEELVEGQEDDVIY